MAVCLDLKSKGAMFRMPCLLMFLACGVFAHVSVQPSLLKANCGVFLQN